MFRVMEQVGLAGRLAGRHSVACLRLRRWQTQADSQNHGSHEESFLHDCYQVAVSLADPPRA